jgi:peroxiredoxin
MRLALLAVLAWSALAADPPKTGPAAGASIPAFEGVDQNGKRQTFETLRGPKGLVLLFTRSADWCPFCKAQLLDLNQKAADFRKRGLNVVSITYDSVEILRDYGTRKSIGFPMLSDPDSKAIRAFGVLNESIPKGTPFHGVANPGTFIIDEKGIVKSKFLEPDFRESYTAASILTKAFGADGVERTTVDNPQLKLTYSASDSVLAPGRRATLILDIELKPKMHIYAPGVQSSYIPIEWTMPDAKPWTVQAPAFPPSKRLRLEAIEEVAPVYEGKLRIVRDVALDPKAPAGAAALEGTFRYQACDDRMCYIPKSIPLKWTFQVTPLDSQRVPEALQRK